MVDEHTAEGFNLQPREIDRLEQESGEKNLRRYGDEFHALMPA